MTAGAPAAKPATVLLVQDVAAFRDLETTFLRRHELRVQVVESPAAVRRRRAGDGRPDLVVVDLVASGETVELCASVKADADLAGVPVIAVLPRTARAAGEAAGADAIVYKPVVQREFLDAIRRFVPLAERRSRRTPAALRFTWTTEGGVTGQSISRDLSTSGAFLESDRVPPVGCPLDLAFRLPGDEREIACGAHVRNVPQHGALGFGVEFDGLEPEDLSRVQAFVDALHRRSLAVP
jgi:CheY-like chemotaxis protein